MIKIKEYRLSKDLSQKQLAGMLHISAGNLCEWEKGRIEPSICALKKLSEILDVSVDELIGNDNERDIRHVQSKHDELLFYFNLLDEKNQQNILEIIKKMAT